VKQQARELRCRQTDAERQLWQRLRNRQLGDCKFRRQEVVGAYIADFVCFDEKLIIELDGGQHLEQQVYDQHRTAELEKMGYRLIRFWNDQVLKNTDDVLEEILRVLTSN
jgi:very-short-patch-repair endonuclease